MKDPIFFLLLGLGIGALYAMIGSAMVVAYKGSGVIHFGLPAMATYCLYNYFELRNPSEGKGGDIRLPWFDFLPDEIPITRGISIPLPNIPVIIDLNGDGGAIGFVPAMALALGLAVLIGLMVHFLVFKPLRNAAPLGKVVAAIAVGTYFIGICQLHFTKDLNQPTPRNILPSEGLRNFIGLGLGPNTTIPRLYGRDNLYLAAIAVVVGVLLWAVYKYTKFGVATRAAAGNEKGAVLLGYSPDFLAASNWVISSVVAAFAAIIVGNKIGTITPIQLMSLLGAFLAAMLVGGLNSIILATIGGLALGMVETFSTSWLRSQNDIIFSWDFPVWLRAGIKEALPLIVISAVLVIRGKKLPVRGTIEQKRLPLVPYPRRAIHYTVILSVIVILLAFHGRSLLSDTLPLGLMSTLVFTVFNLSLVVIAGYLGQISLGNLALAGTAAFFMARLFADGKARGTNLALVSGPGLPWGLAMAGGVAMAILVGVLLGIPALRIRGVQLAVVTIAASELLRTLYFENDELTGLRAGVPGYVPRPTFFGTYLGSPKCNIPIGESGLCTNGGTNNPNFIIFLLVFVVGACWLVMNLRRSGTGRRFLSVRANERAAAAAGVNVPRTKLLAFGISAGLAGVAGCLIAFQQDSVASANFPYQMLFPLLTFVYLAGITSINGAILGSALGVGIVLSLNKWWLAGASIDIYQPLIGGIAVILTAIIHPEGQAVFFQPMMRYAGNWLVRARGKEWLSFFKRYVPWLVGGGLLAYLWFPARVDTYNAVVCVLIGAWLGVTLVRQIAMGFYRKARGMPPADRHFAHAMEHDAEDGSVPPPSVDTPQEVHA